MGQNIYLDFGQGCRDLSPFLIGCEFKSCSWRSYHIFTGLLSPMEGVRPQICTGSLKVAALNLMNARGDPTPSGP